MIVKVALGGPSDAEEAKRAVDELEHRLNRDRELIQRDISILVRRWPHDTHSTIGTDTDGQLVTSEQIFEDSDVVVIVFKSQLGSPTSRYDSGTVEEIENAARLGKLLHVYFFDGENPDADPDELAKLTSFREKLLRAPDENRLGGLYGTWTKPEDLIPDLEDALRSDIPKIEAAKGDFAQWLDQIRPTLVPVTADSPAHLPMRTYRDNLLDFRSDLVLFCGRDKEMAQLRQFCDGDEPVSWWAVTGSGGSGKSRLAYELCSALLQDGWEACFLDSDFFERSTQFTQWDYPKDLLLVVDYVTSYAEKLGAWLAKDSLSRGRSGNRTHRLRVLMLERAGFPDQWRGSGEAGAPMWYTNLDRRHSNHGLWDRQYSRHNPAIALSKLADADMVRILTALSLEDKPPIPEDDAGELVTRLKSVDPDRQRPLYLLFLAEAYMDSPHGDWRTWDRGGLLTFIYNREERQLVTAIKCSDSFLHPDKIAGIAMNLWAFATATSPIAQLSDLTDIPFTANEVKKIPEEDRDDFTHVVRSCCGSSGAMITPYKPDIPGEYLVLERLRVLASDDPQKLHNFVQSAWLKSPSGYADFCRQALIDFLDDYPELFLLNTDHLDDGLLQTPDSVDAMTDYIGMLEQVYRYLYAQNRFYESLTICQHLQETPFFTSDQFFRARTLSSLSSLYDDLNHYEQAESAGTEALAIHRKLAETDPDTYTPGVAYQLNNLAVLYSKGHQFKKAETTINEAVTLRRKLAETDPDEYTSALAASLNNLGNLYWHRSQYKKAKPIFAQVLEMYRKLAETNPDEYTPDVARSLLNIGETNQHLQLFKQTEREYTEALSLCRGLAEINPDAYIPSLALQLNNLGNFSTAQHHYEEAETLLNEAIMLYRTLVETNREAYNSDLALSLSNLGYLKLMLQQYEQASYACSEAINLYRTLVKANPDVYAPDLALALNNLGTVYEKQRLYEQAESAFTESVKLRRRLILTDDVYGGDLV